MKSRTHEVKIRLNDEEFDRLNKMVDQTIYNRETVLRLILDGFSLREIPKDYREFTWELRRLGQQLRDFEWNKGLTPEERVEFKKLGTHFVALGCQLDMTFFPYFKESEMDDCLLAKYDIQ